MGDASAGRLGAPWKVIAAAAAVGGVSLTGYMLCKRMTKKDLSKKFEMGKDGTNNINVHEDKNAKNKNPSKKTRPKRDADLEGSLIPDVIDAIEEAGGMVLMTPEDHQGEIDKRKKALEQLGLESFKSTVNRHGLQSQFKRVPPKTICANIGLYCNQACNHCHVDSSPLRKEQMSIATADRIIELLRASPTIEVVDITGGAPELNQAFHHMVREIVKIRVEQRRKIRIIDRCNLTVLCEPGQEGLATFLRESDVSVIASLPCYSEDNTDKQRGRHVFKRSIEGLRLLNNEGYGKSDSKLRMDLVYNPGGAFLPPAQEKLQGAYKERLMKDHGIEFSSLICLANMPIKRFYDFLRKRGEELSYMELLVRNFNPDTVPSLMCRDTVSISWAGNIYDCDFNMQLDLELHRPGGSKPLSVWDISAYDDQKLQQMNIRTMAHCYACTAGQGSS